MEKYLSSSPLSAGRFIMKWESGSSTIKWEESGVFIFTSADNSWQLVTIWFIIINHCYSWIPGSQQISLYRFISFLDVTMSHLSQNDKRSCARDTQPPECPSAQNFIMLRKNWAFHFWKVYIGMVDNQMWGKWALFRAIWSVHGGRSSKSDCCNSVPMQKIVSFHRRIANPPIPSHGGCRHLKHSKHWTYNAVLGTSSLTKMDEFPIQKHYIEATFDHKRKHRKHKCQHFS